MSIAELPKFSDSEKEVVLSPSALALLLFALNEISSLFDSDEDAAILDDTLDRLMNG